MLALGLPCSSYLQRQPDPGCNMLGSDAILSPLRRMVIVGVLACIWAATWIFAATMIHIDTVSILFQRILQELSFTLDRLERISNKIFVACDLSRPNGPNRKHNVPKNDTERYRNQNHDASSRLSMFNKGSCANLQRGLGQQIKQNGELIT